MSDYLIHFNKNHSKANGQFVSGDGDGDGISNDHKNQKKELTPEEKKARDRKRALIGIGAGLVGTAVAATAVVVIEKNRKKSANDASLASKRSIGKKLIDSSKINNTPLLESTAWTQQKISTDWGNITRKQAFEAPKAWNIGVHTTGYGNSDTRIFNVKSPYKGSWGKNRTWGWNN